jgi:PAS domain S-box-containing protein
MKIKNRLYISAGISIILVVILFSLVLVTSGRIAEENKKHQLLMDVYESVSELDIVTYDYLLHREKRMEQQWNLKYNSLGGILDEATGEQGLIISIRADYAALGDLFSQITTNYKARQRSIQEGASQERIDTAIGLEERLVAQLLIKSHSIITDASRLAEEAHIEATEAQRLAANLTLILMIILAFTVTTSSLLVASSISKPLSKLADYSRRVGEGEYTADIEIKGKDEVASVASDVKSMVGQLLTTSEELKKDITERKRAEKELKDSEEYLKILFDYAPDAYYISDLKGKFIDGNKAAEKLMGYKKEELIGKSFLKLNLLTLAAIPKAAKLLVKNLRGQPTGPDEFVINRKDNSKVTVEISTYPVKIKERTVVLGIARDITERKKAIEEIEKLAKFPTENPNPVLRISKDGTVLYHNSASESLLEHWHYKEGKPLQDRWFQFVLDALEDNDIKTVETEIGDKVISLTFAPIVEKGFVNVYGLDITERKQAEERLKKSMNATIDTTSKIIEARDPYTFGHQYRVCQLAVPLAQELGLSQDKVEGIRIASLIHDIGKISLPTEILSKPSKLTDIEFSLIKGHSQIGYDILKSIDFSYPIAQIVLQHHERLNGTGYPNNLKGDEIILEAKIIGIADVVEAMSSHRPYRPALGIDVALEEISKNKGTLYDPEVVDVCIKLFKEKEFKF